MAFVAHVQHQHTAFILERDEGTARRNLVFMHHFYGCIQNSNYLPSLRRWRAFVSLLNNQTIKVDRHEIRAFIKHFVMNKMSGADILAVQKATQKHAQQYFFVPGLVRITPEIHLIVVSYFHLETRLFGLIIRKSDNVRKITKCFYQLRNENHSRLSLMILRLDNRKQLKLNFDFVRLLIIVNRYFWTISTYNMVGNTLIFKVRNPNTRSQSE